MVKRTPEVVYQLSEDYGEAEIRSLWAQEYAKHPGLFVEITVDGVRIALLDARGDLTIERFGVLDGAGEFLPTSAQIKVEPSHGERHP